MTVAPYNFFALLASIGISYDERSECRKYQRALFFVHDGIEKFPTARIKTFGTLLWNVLAIFRGIVQKLIHCHMPIGMEEGFSQVPRWCSKWYRAGKKKTQVGKSTVL